MVFYVHNVLWLRPLVSFIDDCSWKRQDISALDVILQHNIHLVSISLTIKVVKISIDSCYCAEKGLSTETTYVTSP